MPSERWIEAFPGASRGFATRRSRNRRTRQHASSPAIFFRSAELGGGALLACGDAFQLVGIDDGGFARSGFAPADFSALRSVRDPGTRAISRGLSPGSRRAGFYQR